jgi:16S rRNA (cytosine967-C5)-methyltransferase
MSYLHTHINTAEKIISNYTGAEPFHHHLKTFFKEYKKAGSKDRKQVSHLCYTYFRIGRALMERSFRERLIAALLLCDPQSVYLDVLIKDYSEKSKEAFKPIQEKHSKENDAVDKVYSGTPIDHLEISEGVTSENIYNGRIEVVQRLFPEFNSDLIFPFEEELSEGLDKHTYAKSFLNQPDLHVRLRPGKNSAGDKLKTIGGFLRSNQNSYVFNNGTNLEADIKLDRDVVIQDWSSQQVANFFPELPGRISIWDACAASGGKSLLAVDHYKNPELTVTDKRSNILHNLVQRFSIAELRNYKSMVTDLSVSKPHKPAGFFDLVIADIPCSGSGTWGRNPENLYYFNEVKVGEYQLLQRSIVRNLFDSVKPRGYLLYITCSVFRKENEENVDLILENGFELVKSGIINGASENADYMFAALLRKNN